MASARLFFGVRVVTEQKQLVDKYIPLSIYLEHLIDRLYIGVLRHGKRFENILAKLFKSNLALIYTGYSCNGLIFTE